MKTKGTVKWFNESKGFGKISTKQAGEVFVEFDAIAKVRALSPGASVIFELEERPEGLFAINVQMAGPHGGGGGLDD